MTVPPISISAAPYERVHKKVWQYIPWARRCLVVLRWLGGEGWFGKVLVVTCGLMKDKQYTSAEVEQAPKEKEKQSRKSKSKIKTTKAKQKRNTMSTTPLYNLSYYVCY